MLVDMHSHSSGISRCCQIPAEQVVEEAKNVGIDALVLTNHYVEYYGINGDYDDLAKRYIAEYEYTKKCGEKIGMKVFFGLEVTMELPGNPHVLIYGVQPQFILDHPQIFYYTQRKLYEVVKQVGGVVVQAHPFRKNIDVLLDLKFLDGVEINCHPLYEATHFEKLRSIAQNNNLILTSGGDYHADTHRAKCGVYFPDHIKDGVEIGKYLLAQSPLKLCIQEVDSDCSYDYEYARKV